jgi:ActR/RegA family two-component response regulator
MKDLLNQALALFTAKVNLLLVDDDRLILNSLRRNFISPALNITAIDTFSDAVRAVGSSRVTWHCWVLDIDLGAEKTGIDIMKAAPNYPFVLILSGLQSMGIASQAIKQGALHVFDKDPASFDRLYDEVCKTAALGYVLGGKNTQYLPVYRLLYGSVITTPDEWAEKACVTLRQLHRICEVHPITSPRTTLAHYYALYTMLWKGAQPFDNALPPGIEERNREYTAECIIYTLRKSP